MKIREIPFGVTNWDEVPASRHEGTAGFALWRTKFFGPEDDRVRMRLVEYSPGYVADHWCSKGHFLYVLQGELDTSLEDGRQFRLTAGMSYQVADQAEPHTSRTDAGALLLIID